MTSTDRTNDRWVSSPPPRVGLLVPSSALAATVYEGYSSVGSVNRSYGDRYDVKAGYGKVG
jgi:hypothetical protein